MPVTESPAAKIGGGGRVERENGAAPVAHNDGRRGVTPLTLSPFRRRGLDNAVGR